MIGERKPVPDAQSLSPTSRFACAFRALPFPAVSKCSFAERMVPVSGSLLCLILDLFLTRDGGKALLSSDSTSVCLPF